MEPRQFSPSRVARKTVGRENGATSLEDNLTIPGRAENAHTIMKNYKYPKYPSTGGQRKTLIVQWHTVVAVKIANYL